MSKIDLFVRCFSLELAPTDTLATDQTGLVILAGNEQHNGLARAILITRFSTLDQGVRLGRVCT